MTYFDRCGDCGCDIKERRISKRHNVCDGCWENRGWLVEHMKSLPLDKFQHIQRSMAYHTGTAKRQIIKLQSEFKVE